jgi:hypothetical protein
VEERGALRGFSGARDSTGKADSAARDLSRDCSDMAAGGERRAACRSPSIVIGQIA